MYLLHWETSKFPTVDQKNTCGEILVTNLSKTSKEKKQFALPVGGIRLLFINVYISRWGLVNFVKGL